MTRRDEAVSLVNKMEDDAEIAPEIELTISNWDTLFGEEGIVKTPLGEVKMGENQFAKLMRQGRESKLGMIKPTLENPDVIIEASSEAKEGSITERGSSYIFVKAFRKSDGSRYYYFTSVTVSKEGKEVVVSSQEKSRNRLLRLLTDEEIIWRTPKDATTSSAERQGLDYVQPLDAETATKGSGLTPQRISSADKVTESSEEWQEQEEKFSPTPSGNTGGEEGTYTLSSKTSENGESFYQNNDGNIDLADIPDEVFDKIGKPKAPFRLTPSMLKHVFDRHGKEMGLHHADDAIDFVLDVLNNFDHVRQGDKGAIIFSIENGRSRTGRRAVTILLDSQRGEYYGIKTSGYERIEGLHKRPLLWEKGAKETSATGVAPANVTTNETQQGNELTGSASNHGNDPMGKVTESSEELQEKEEKFTPAPIEDGEVQSPSVKYQPIIRATFNKVKREQGIIEPIAEKKRKPFTVFDVTVKEPHRPMFGGVYYDGGMAVATNGVVMFAHKEAYDEAKEGKIITSKGDVIEGKFPDWRGAIPKETIPTGLQTEPLLEFVNGALARMKAEKAKKYEVDGALAYIKFQDGNVVCCQLVDLQKMLRAAKSIGADDLRLGTDKEFLVAESPAGKAIVIIQGEEKARYNAGYNNFSYEAPTVKGKEEVSDGALDNPYPSEKEVEQEANEATEKSNEERDTRKEDDNSSSKDVRTDRIEDVGEHIWGARKDLQKKIVMSLANVTEQALVANAFGKVYKKLDLKKAVENGVLREKDARFYEDFFALIDQQKPKVSRSESWAKMQNANFKTKTELWATLVASQIKILKEFVEANEQVRDSFIENGYKQQLSDEARKSEEEKIRSVRLDNPDRKIGNCTTPNPLWVIHEIYNRIGWKLGDKVDIPYGIIVPGNNYTGYLLKDKKEQTFYGLGSRLSLEEAIEAAAYLTRLKRGDTDLAHPLKLFSVKSTESVMGETGRYNVSWSNPGSFSIKDRQFDSKEEADKFAATKKGSFVSPIKEVVGKKGFKIYYNHPLDTDRIVVSNEKFDTEEEALSYLNSNYEEINELLNETLKEELVKKGQKKGLTADDLIAVTRYTLLNSRNWMYSVQIDAKYVEDTSFPCIIKDGFSTKEEANAFAARVKDRIFEKFLKYRDEKKQFVFFSTANNERFGEDYRNGRDVEPNELINTFGFRGVQFGNWTNQKDRQMAINQAYDAFLDLAKILNVSPKAISLDGELGIAFGARGSGMASAHYEPSEVVINLTKTKGAGSLAHEWWHALDNYFSRKAGNSLGNVTADRSIKMRGELRKAYNDLVEKVEQSEYGKRSRKKGSYWGSIEELTARLFAEWCDQEMKKRGEINSFLSTAANIELWQQNAYAYYNSVNELGSRESISFDEFQERLEALAGNPYPSAKEVEGFSNLIRNIFDTIEESKDDNTGNVVLKQFSNVLLSADTESQRLATDAALEGLKRAGVPVEVVSDEQAAAMLGEQKGVELSAKQKRALETASPAMQEHHTVVSSADGTKVLKGLDNAIEEDLKITDHVQFMKTPSGTLYGWTVGGKIYLTKDGLNPNTPIHEYTHLWARAMKERNKEGWQSVKELLRDTPVWDEVLKDKNYQDILDDEDAIASEALSRISGKKNAEKMEAEARKMIDEAKDYVDKAKAISLLERMKSALKKFWNWVGKDLFGIKKFSSVDEITDRVLYDLTNGTDLKGVASEKVEKQQVSTGSEEERAIIEHAKESGTYMKAPNGKPTRLTEKQWAQVRTKAFKSWFGDWEKAARIEKLRKSEPVVITGEEIAPSDELKQYKRNALEYGKTLRGEYTNEDTKETIALTGGNSRGGIREILQHDYKDIEHLQSIAAIPQIIEKSTYIDEAPNEDVEKYPGIKSFRYYVCGLKIGNNDYTVKAVIAVQNNGDRYYDHKLSSIEKGKLLSIIPTIQEAGIEDNLPLSIGKDRRLLSILQTNSSKVVDENGEPLVVHHSTDNEFDTFSKEKLGENTDQNASDDSVAATAHIGFWFNTNDLTGTLFQERDVAGYLDVKEPYEFNSLESLVEDMSYYSSAEEFVDRLKEDGYDGIVVRKDEEMSGTSYVAFEPNQIKSATDNNGEFSQESDDIRYRESKGSSERTLVGIHNISADKLSKAIKQGGLANPSVAVIDISKQQHTGYGEISLIMPSDKINKRTGKNAGTFEGDAWTPMYPSVERQMSREGSLVMEHDIKALPNEMQLGVRNALRNWLDNRVDTKLSYLYLFQQGKAPDFETIKPKYNKEVHRAFGDIMHEVTNVYELSKNDIEKLVDLYVKTELNGDINEFNQSYERNIAKHKEILSNKKPGSLRYEKALIYLRDAEEYGRPIDVLQRFVDEVWRDKNTQGRVSIEKTFDAANKKIKEDGLEHDYKKWTDGLNERYQTKEVIFDGFTPSGMRRYVPNTLENVSKLMKKQGRNASNGIGSSFSNFAASVMKANTSLDSIRKKKDKLTNDHQDLDDFEEKWQDVYVDLSRKLQPDANAYDDYGFARLQEAASKADPQAYLQKEYGVTLSDEDTQRLKDMVKAIKEERPSMYFETKFERPVTFDEFAAAVVPHNTDAEIKQQLRDAGLKVVEYEAGNEESRAKAVEEASKSDDIRFRQEERAARELAEVNERFNEELQKQIDGTLPAGHVYQLGMPGEILLAAGFPTMPIELSATRLSEKSRQANHIFKLSKVKDLVKEINNPMAIFRYGNNAKNVIVGIEHNGKQFLVGVHFNQSHRGMEISDVRGIFPKDNAEWLNWISQGKADYLNKEKIQTLIDQQRINLAEVDYLDLDSVANILKDFQNPTIDGKNHSALSENTLPAEPSHDREAMRNEAVQLSDKLHTPIKIVEDVKDITHSNAEVERRKRNSKGWYDVRTGEVVVVLPNNRDVEDVAATVMHETVAHKGLRELVGKEHYDDFLDEVYKHLRGDLKQRVDAEAGRSFVDDSTKNRERAKSYERHRRTAVDELFGDMAEKPFEEFSEGERTLWQKLKEVVRKLLDKFLESLKLPKWFELGDNELRYMLWRSKERLERGKEHPIDFARDMVMREELGLSEAARMRMGDTPDTFKARQRRAVEEKGVVMPGLNDAEVKVVDVPRHSFTGTGKDALRSAERWAKDNITGMHTATNSDGIEFDYNISGKSIEKYVSASSIAKSENLGVHLSVLKTLPNVIANSIEVEEHADYAKDKSSKRSAENEVNAQSLMHRFYGAVNIDGKLYRVKTTIREYADTNRNANAHNYELTKIELLDAPSVGGIETSNRPVAMTSNSSISVAKLLKDVEKSYDSGKKVLDESRKADENPILYRDGGETEDIWKDKSMGLHERTTAAAMRLADKHQENKTLRNDAMRAIGNNLADLRKAMSLQRKFDMATVKRVSDLARVLMNNGYIGDMTQQEVKSLLAAVRNSVGHNDIDRDVQKVMEIMVKNQLRRAEKALSALEAIKGSKVNAKGVKVQGKLDAAGAQLMEVFKNIIEPIVNNHTLM
nr:PBECR2 nuclease fold domain-containing protein [uncultured Alloprevotella sp.]